MAQIKLAEYTFDNSVGDVMPSLTPNTITMTKEDSVSGTTTRRIVYIDDSVMPTQIGGFRTTALLTLDYLNVTNSVTTIDCMFYQATNMTYINVSNWDVSNVTNMKSAFYQCEKLQTIEGLENWNVSKNTTFSMTFYNCRKLKEANITNWKAPLCTNMHQMFRQCYALKNLDLSGFEVSTTSGVDMSRCFQQCDNLKITGLNSMKIKPINLNFAFANLINTEVYNNFDLSTWDTSLCTNFSCMFEYSYSIRSINVSNWNMNNAKTATNSIFNSCTNLQKITGLETWDRSGHTNYTNLFAGCASLTDLSGVYNWDVSSAINFYSVFNGCKSLTKLDLRNWVTSSATSFQDMFASCHNLEVIRVDNFDTSKVTGIGLNAMFSDCKKVKTLNLNSFVNAGLGNFLNFCYKCESLEYISAQNFIWGNFNSAQGLFTNCKSLKYLDFTTFDGSNITTATVSLRLGNSLDGVTCPIYYNSNTCTANDTALTGKSNAIDVKGRLMAIYDFNNTVTTSDSAYPTLVGSAVVKTIDTQGSESYITHRVISVDVMPTGIKFNSIPGLLNVDYLAVTNTTTTLHNLFGNCTKMTNVNTFGWDTSNVTVMETAFGVCPSLKELDLSSCNLQKVQNLYGTFSDCSGLETLHLPTTFTTQLISLGRMFWGCSKLSTITGLSEIDTSKVSNFDRVFEGVTSLMEIDLSKWNTSFATGSTNMFSGWTSDQLVHIHDANWTIDTSSYNATFVRRLSKLIVKYTFDNSVSDCLPTITGITTSDYKVSDIVNDKITTRLLSTDSTSPITKIQFGVGSIPNKESLRTVEYYNTTDMTNMANVFDYCQGLTYVNTDGWDTSKVTTFNRCFAECYALKELDTTNIDTSSATNLESMFYCCTALTDINVKDWNVSKVITMKKMFSTTRLTSIDVSGWYVPNLTDMSSMFAGHANQPHLQSVNMSNWTMETPANMNSMFYNNPNLTSIDFTGSKMVSSNLQQTFQSCSKLTSLDVSRFDTSQCTNMSYMLAGLPLDGWDISNLNTSSANNMSNMFEGCIVTGNLDLSFFDVRKVTNMTNMFAKANISDTIILDNWDLNHNATNITYMFSACKAQHISFKWKNTDKITSLKDTFNGCPNLISLDFSSWDTTSLTNIQNTFMGCGKLAEVDLSSFDFRNKSVATGQMFTYSKSDSTVYYDPALFKLDPYSIGGVHATQSWVVRPSKNNGYWLDMTGITGATEITLFNENNLPTEEILTDWGDGTQNSELTHTYSTAGEYIVVSNLQNNTSGGNSLKDYLTKMVVYYAKAPGGLCFNYNKITEVTLTNNWAEKTIEKYGQKVSMAQMFRNCPLLELPNLEPIKQFKPTYCVGMFYNCQKFTSIDLTGWDLSNCTGMDLMFTGCTNLTEIKGIENWNISKCTSFDSLFLNCSSLTSLDISSWDISSATNVGGMFNSCGNLIELKLMKSELNNITNVGSMFRKCSSLTSIDLSSLNLSKATTTQYMFLDCLSLTDIRFNDLSFSNISNCTDMFSNCMALTNIDLSSIHITKNIKMNHMFSNCPKLQSIKMFNCDGNVETIHYAFNGCKVLKTLDLSNLTIAPNTSVAGMFWGCEELEMVDLSNIRDIGAIDNIFNECPKLTTLGLLYSTSSTINTLASKMTSTEQKTIYYQDADPSQLTPVEGVTFKKYQTPTTIQLPPHIQLHSLPDGTRDEVDIKTGILTRKTYRVKITGSNSNVDYVIRDVNVQGNITIQCTIRDVPTRKFSQSKTKTYCDFNVIPFVGNVSFSETGKGNVGCGWYGATNMTNTFCIRIPISYLEELTLEGFQELLNKNPINIVYELETPTTEQLILNYNNSCDYGRILPTGMCDKYDVVNSMYTQTMTSILLDGENTWDAMEEFENTVKFTATGTTVGVEELNMLGAGGLYCDNDLFPNINDDSDVEHCRVDEAGNKFYIYVDKEMLMSPDLIGWQIWLQANKFNLIYELAEHLIYVKPYEELDPTQARWEGMDCMRDGAIKYHTNSSDNITMYPTLEYVAPSINNFEVTMLEPNTEYTMYAEGIGKGDTINLGGTDINFNNGTVYTSGDNQWLRVDNNDSFYNMVITKGDTTGEVVPYFEGMTSVENPKVQSPCKNLFILQDYNYGANENGDQRNTARKSENGTITFTSPSHGSYASYNIATGEYYPSIMAAGDYNFDYAKTQTLVEGAGTYTIQLDVNYIEGQVPETYVYYDDSKVVAYSWRDGNDSVLKLTVEKKINFIAVSFWYNSRIVNTTISNIQVEKGEVATDYVRGGGSKVSYTDLKLRSLPNGVKDTINVVTGEYIQRVGEVVLNGSEDWVLSAHDNSTSFYTPLNDLVHKEDYLNSISCDKFVTHTYEWTLHNSISLNGISAYVDWLNDYPNENWLYIKHADSESSVEKFKQWLKENPVTVQYELAEPITKKLDPQTLLAYADGTINLSSDTGLLPTTHYTVPSTNTFHLPSMKTGTRYTLKYPSASGSITIGDINYSISSDSMLFTTPLKINGDTSAIIFSDANPENVVLLEGAYNKREVPFFTGVKSVKNPNITITDQLSTESTTYNCETEIELRGLPNGVADKLDIIKGKLTTNVGIRPYQEGDENLPNIWTDGYETVYALSSPVVKNVIIDRPTVTTNGLIELSSDYLIPQLNYRAPSSNNFPLDLLQPNTTYTLYADTLTSGTYTLGGTKTGVYSQPHTVTLGDMTDNLLTFNGDLGLSNVMLVKGNSLKTTLPPYFLGIRSVTDGHLLVEGMAGEMNELTIDEGIVLRDCNGVKDTIDLITGTLTKRTGEITLTGAEGWYRADNESTTDHNVFKLTLGGLKEALVMCDTLQSVFDTKMMDCIHAHTNELCIVIANATIGGNTVNALKSWLNQHPTTVVYQLRTPIEVQLKNTWTTLPPTSYDNQTEISSTVSVNSLKPMISVTIATTTLEEIVSNLETRNAQLEEENLATMLALTEVYEMMYMSTVDADAEPTSVSTWNRRIIVSSIGMIYAKLVKRGVKSIEEIPTKLQVEVQYAIDNGLV